MHCSIHCIIIHIDFHLHTHVTADHVSVLLDLLYVVIVIKFIDAKLIVRPTKIDTCPIKIVIDLPNDLTHTKIILYTG